MSNSKRATAALMAASASLRALWVRTLAVKGDIMNGGSRSATRARACSAYLTTCGARCGKLLTRSYGLKRWNTMFVRLRREYTHSRSGFVVSCEAAGLETASAKMSNGDVPVSASSVAVALSRNEWMARAKSHQERVRALTNGSVHHDHNDPIFNFLFEYYHFKPRTLLQWTPGFGVFLRDADPSEKGCPLPQKAWEPEPCGGGRYTALGLDAKRRTSIEWIRDFLEKTSARTPVFHCFGLHEWAMLYCPPGAERDARRLYQPLPLRVSQEEVRDRTTVFSFSKINDVVEGKGGAMGCTHFDAFRFFTPEARPLNPIQLDRESQKLHDQPGCIHANMDLFKWALKLWPLLPSEEMADALELAVACRMLDMRASPYDLTAHGRAPDGAVGKGGRKVARLPPDSWDSRPVRIETEEGRKEYQHAQLELYRKSMPVRRSLVSHIDRMLEAWR